MTSYNGFSPAQRERGAQIQREAIRNGLLKSPMEQPCCLCGQDQGIRHLHNEDYSDANILSDAHVLCWRCHMMLHGRYRHPNSFAKYMIDVAIYKKRFAPVFRGNDWDALNQHYID